MRVVVFAGVKDPVVCSDDVVALAHGDAVVVDDRSKLLKGPFTVVYSHQVTVSISPGNAIGYTVCYFHHTRQTTGAIGGWREKELDIRRMRVNAIQ